MNNSTTVESAKSISDVKTKRHLLSKHQNVGLVQKRGQSAMVCILQAKDRPDLSIHVILPEDAVEVDNVVVHHDGVMSQNLQLNHDILQHGRRLATLSTPPGRAYLLVDA
ncbi:hypothetical protein MFIFM68171_03048 [Madurella fahalii]|uniref:Uncharacterized protein n=1 Tax=Madurella fahalii TaxID=1157608 RepID=A0ABQ0G522_9PEZI